MRFSILLPHYKTWKMTFYTIHQLLKFRGRHQLDIFVVDNHPQDKSAEYLRYFGDKIQVIPYPTHLLQSHGIAYDFAVPRLRTDVFITIESDSFPTQPDWLDWYELLLRDGYDSAGSCLDLSGGQFVHTAGAFYKKSIWQTAKRYVDNAEYQYFPNIAMKDNFPCDLMVHDSVREQFITNPESLAELAPEYRHYLAQSRDTLTFNLGRRMGEYLPVARGVFHNRMGNVDEAIGTYRERNVTTERHRILLDNRKPLIWRMGMEPGQWFCYWMLAGEHKVYSIPTETIWMPNRQNQQQSKTVMENGFTHLWAVTAYNDATDPELMDIITYKKNQMEELYRTIPQHERI